MEFDFALALTWYLALIVAMVFHEAAHAWVAKIGGDLTAYESGQVTLNPIPHMRREPFGTIVMPIISLFLLGFPLGFAHAPYNPYWADAHPKRAAIMSAAGPASNLLIAGLLFAVMKIGLSADWFEYPIDGRIGIARDGGGGLLHVHMLSAADGATTGIGYAIAQVLPVLFFMNFLLGIFNLIPVPPLDGAGIAEGALPGKLGAFFGMLRRDQTMALLGLLVAWYLFDVVWRPAWRVVMSAF